MIFIHLCRSLQHAGDQKFWNPPRGFLFAL